MAEDLTYSDLQPLSTGNRNGYLNVITKRNAIKLPNDKYYFNLKEQVFDPYALKYSNYESKKPIVPDKDEYYLTVVPDEDEYYLTQAPTYSYAQNLKENGADTFESAIAGMVTNGDTPFEINQAIDDLLLDADTVKKYGIDTTKGYVYKGTAESIWKDYNQAKISYANKKAEAEISYGEKQAEADAWVSPYKYAGIPDPSERYNPTAFKNYVKYENAMIAKYRKVTGGKQETAQERVVVEQLRKKAGEYYASKGRTPYYDAILRLEANK